jgi:mono/diheme cytochrome c family protein
MNTKTHGLRCIVTAVPSFIRLSTALSILVLLTAGRTNAQFVAVPLPDPKIPGFQFPEAESTIVDWVFQASNKTPSGPQSFAKIHLHGWGIWTALTMETDQVFDGQKLRTFETWPTPQDVMAAPPNAKGAALMLTAPRSRSSFQPFHQFGHVKGTKGRVNPLRAAALINPDQTITGFVKYDPSAASHIVQQGLLSKKNLGALLQAGANAIPSFPVTAFALKPVFRPLSGNPVAGRYYKLAVWPGPPDTPQEWPSTKWKGWIWIDIQGGGQGKGQIDATGADDGSSRTDATTYPVSSFINFRMSAQDAASANAAIKEMGGKANVASGDYSVLLAMHVAGREITRWTWETFWWTPTPDAPHLPSSPEIAKLRPAQLQGAPRNYAMALAYNMVAPVQPYVGGKNAGESVYAYNPWLEAGFGPQDLPDSISGISQGKKVGNNYGVQTNCMSCHGSANYTSANVPNAPAYSGDRYIDLTDPRFRGTLKSDFLWSIPDNAK